MPEKVLRILFGLALCTAIAIWIVYFTSLPLFWEHEDEPFVYSITWRSGIVFLMLFAVTQGLSFLAFRWITYKRRMRSIETNAMPCTENEIESK
jgi:hypothetical protein